jgi:protein TIF31
MTKVAENFFLEKEVVCLDEEGKQFKIAGGLEVKGILGSDKRKYILDLMRLSPRDLNYP